MSGATAEALAWKERADKEQAAGIITGAREICPGCLHPLRQAWGEPEVVPQCVCGTKVRVGGERKAHGLEGLDNGVQTGTTTYG